MGKAVDALTRTILRWLSMGTLDKHWNTVDNWIDHFGSSS